MLALSWLYVQLTYRPYSNRTFENQTWLKIPEFQFLPLD